MSRPLGTSNVPGRLEAIWIKRAKLGLMDARDAWEECGNG